MSDPPCTETVNDPNVPPHTLHGRPPHCGTCGRFLRRTWNGLEYEWRCVKVGYDYWYGGWEHD